MWKSGRKKGVWVKTNRPLLYNYVFVRSSENEIYKMMTMTGLSLYSFLPRIRDGKCEYYPYLSDEAMENLRWVAHSYADIVPVYTPEPERLMKLVTGCESPKGNSRTQRPR